MQRFRYRQTSRCRGSWYSLNAEEWAQRQSSGIFKVRGGYGLLKSADFPAGAALNAGENIRCAFTENNPIRQQKGLFVVHQAEYFGTVRNTAPGIATESSVVFPTRTVLAILAIVRVHKHQPYLMWSIPYLTGISKKNIRKFCCDLASHQGRLRA